MEAVARAQGCMQILKELTGHGAHVMKLDISQAVDTLSHKAIWRCLMDTAPSQEALRLWQLSQDTHVALQIGADSWMQPLHGARRAPGHRLFGGLVLQSHGLLYRRHPSVSYRKGQPAFERFALLHILLYADVLGVAENRGS